jgi:hypothetical protein
MTSDTSQAIADALQQLSRKPGRAHKLSMVCYGLRRTGAETTANPSRSSNLHKARR